MTSDKMQWWREARFGLFVHWGLYAIPAGVWNGIINSHSSEWIMNHLRIPVSEYEKLAEQFNPVDFNADEFVRLAKDAGMRYIAITAKHHDGFCMFKTKYSDYNIVDATPFGRDIVAEIAEACRKHDIKFCIYYSHILDWHHPHAVGNDWDFKPSLQDFEIYYREKCRPQIEELLTNYGEVSVIWFDMPGGADKFYTEDIVNLVRELQPNCIFNSRIGYGFGDYVTMGDNTVPLLNKEGDWETPYTLNDNWGYNQLDNNWKDPLKCIDLLTNIVGKGGNFLLNIGPDANGNIPEGSANILREVGEWMRVNGSSIYGTQGIPTYPIDTREIRFTYKKGTLFMHVFNWPKIPILYIHHLMNKVSRVYALANPDIDLSFSQGTTDTGAHYVRVDLPNEPTSKYSSVIALDIEGMPEYDNINF